MSLLDLEALIRNGQGLDAQQLMITPIDRSVRIRGKREDLVGALSNLVCNAIQASGEAPEIQISVNAIDARRIQIRVRDQGPGIDETHLPHIFDPFYTTRACGHGLRSRGCRDDRESARRRYQRTQSPRRWCGVFHEFADVGTE